MNLDDTIEFTMGPCEHPEMTYAGVCIMCGERIVLTGQVPARTMSDPAELDACVEPMCSLPFDHSGLHKGR